MEIFLKLRSKIPIYEQIISQVQQHIVSGKLTDGAQILSIRALAKTLQVSVITVQKAYEELQRKGLIESLSGRGTYIKASTTAAIVEEYWDKINHHLSQALTLAKDSGIRPQVVVAQLTSLANIKEEDKHRGK